MINNSRFCCIAFRQTLTLVTLMEVEKEAVRRRRHWPSPILRKGQIVLLSYDQ